MFQIKCLLWKLCFIFHAVIEVSANVVHFKLMYLIILSNNNYSKVNCFYLSYKKKKLNSWILVTISATFVSYITSNFFTSCIDHFLMHCFLPWMIVIWQPQSTVGLRVVRPVRRIDVSFDIFKIKGCISTLFLQFKSIK